MFPSKSYRSTLGEISTEAEIGGLAERVYGQVFRTDFTAPGFALVSFRQEVESISLRHFMLALKDALETISLQKRGRYLNCLSMLRFDQQTTTKFHLDGAPDESYLMLGYEPSNVQSVLCMADYAHATHDLNLTPQQFLADYNPMFARGEQQLVPYTTRLDDFDTWSSQVLLVNNSRLPFCPDSANVLGVMHQATILTPDPTQSRIVNSIMLTASESEGEEAASLAMLQDFLIASSNPARMAG
ncbi:MAG: hypothetical protein JWN14_5136 [Chthonomonadales bacterium]|nr:hypothetical protein [Chthonomonadales bacterium]